MEFRFLMAQMMVPSISIMLFAPAVLYAVARWRAHREPVADPQLGLKFVLHYFATIAFHVALAGGTLLLYTMIKPGDEHDSKSQMYRAAFGFLIPAGLVLGASLGVLARTNDSQQVGVRKLFTGFNLLITGLVGFSALVLGFQALFMKGSTDGLGHLGGAAILIYCSAWAVLGWRYYLMVVGTDNVFRSQDPPDIVAPPGSHHGPPGNPGASATGLPALGGGSYPPIEKP